MNFYSSLKQKIQIDTNPEMDRRIQDAISLEWKKPAKENRQWIWAAYSSAFVLAVIVILNVNYKPKANGVMALNEAPEMILNYKNIELMASADVSDEEWEKIINK